MTTPSPFWNVLAEEIVAVNELRLMLAVRLTAAGVVLGLTPLTHTQSRPHKD